MFWDLKMCGAMSAESSQFMTKICVFSETEVRLQQVSISSIQNISLGGQDKQVGGVPMMLGKAAVPFGGGHVVSLFSHKKYDSLAIEYLDSRGGFHGAIFRLAKGQGETFKNALIAHGAHIASIGRSGPFAKYARGFPGSAEMECAGRQSRSWLHNS